MKGIAFTLIEIALWDVPRNQMIKAETPEIEAENRRMVLPSYCVLIRHPTLGNILYDTGVAYDREEFWNDEMKGLYKFIELWDLKKKLAELSLTPDDIDVLIVSHLHYDHAGNLRLFANTKAGNNVYVSRAEVEDAYRLVEESVNGISGAYYKPEFKDVNGIDYHLVDGDFKLAEGIELIFLEGHTAGVLGLLVETENTGTVIFPSDAVYSEYHFGPPIVYPGLCADPQAYKANIEKLYHIKKERNATIFFSHDVEEFNTRKKSPLFYD